jgi:hypothetical protein
MVFEISFDSWFRAINEEKIIYLKESIFSSCAKQVDK